MIILVTGATGNIGRLVVDRLLAAGAKHIRALTNNPKKAALPTQVEVVAGYLDRPDTLPAALEGVERMYFAPTPHTVHDVVALVKRAGVRRIVDLSGEEGSWWHSVAAAVERSGLEWIHLWPGEFMENCLIWAEQIRTTGIVRDAYPSSANAPIAMSDIAGVAATALLEDRHLGRAYSLTGPETITRAEQVWLIGAALGKEMPFVELTHEQAVEQLSSIMGEYAEWYISGKAQLVDHPQSPLPTVQAITGHPATTFAEWARKHAAQSR